MYNNIFLFFKWLKSVQSFNNNKKHVNAELTLLQEMLNISTELIKYIKIV